MICTTQWESPTASPHGSVKNHPTNPVNPHASNSINPASAPRHSDAIPPLAPSPRSKNQVLTDLALQHPRQQPRLDFQQSPVAHPMLKQRMRDQRVHPRLIRMEKCLPAPFDAGTDFPASSSSSLLGNQFLQPKLSSVFPSTSYRDPPPTPDIPPDTPKPSGFAPPCLMPSFDSQPTRVYQTDLKCPLFSMNQPTNHPLHPNLLS
jgi:hypothetical protein